MIPSFRPRRTAFPEPRKGGGFQFEKKQERPLTGKVQNLKAAQGEERLARTIERAISKGIVSRHYFRWTTAPRGTNVYKELDELIVKANGEAIAVSIKGAGFVHRNSSEKEQDKINELIILKNLKQKGFNVAEIKTVFDYDLKTQDGADKVGRKLGFYK